MPKHASTIALWGLVAMLLSSACTLAGTGPAPTSRVPTGEAPAEVLTPDNFRTPSPVAPPTEDTACRLTNEEALAVRVSTRIEANEVTLLAAQSTSEIVGRTGQNDWWQIVTPDNRTGWVDASAVEVYGDCAAIPVLQAPTLTPDLTATPAVPSVQVVVPQLNIRRGPGVQFSPPIGSLSQGDTAQIIAVNPRTGWYKVTYNGTQGWVSNQDRFVAVSGNVSNLPTDPGPPTPIPTNTPIPSTPTPTLDPNTNYLSDPGFEGQYTGRGSPDLNIPASWEFTYFESPREFEWQNLRPVAFPHVNGPEVRSGARSLNINRNFATFTAVVYQRVSVPANISVRARAYAWVHTCDPQPAICGSDASSGARVRVGIDPNGGSNPFAGSVVWSGFEAPHDQWREVSVQAQANGGTVTVFLYATQDVPKGLNQMYWDDAGLFVGG